MPREATYTGSALAERMKDLKGWNEDGGTIRRVYATDGWSTTLMLVNMIGFFAEAADHHPDLAVSWGKVEVRLSSHSAGGITDKDVELARVIESNALWRPTGGALAGTSKQWVKAESP
jgi:4a-hydroxytetrahydrobiopterin dehydratase